MTISLQSAVPVLPVADVAAALAHYAALGFSVEPYEQPGGGPPVYGYAERGGVRLHLALVAEIDPMSSASAAYLYVEDADALAAEWSPAPDGSRTLPAADTPYGLREGAHVDPWGNLLRFGAPLAGDPR